MTAWTKGKIINTKAWLNGMGLFGDAGENNFLELKLALRNSLDEIARLQSLVEELVEDGGYWLEVSEMLQADVHGVLKIIQSTQYRKHVRLMKKVRGEK
jgi:hypothetical protein